MIEKAYIYLIKGDYASLQEMPKIPRKNEIEIIKLMGLQISNKKKINIIPDLEKIGNINPKYNHLLFEAKLIALLFNDDKNKEAIQVLANEATKDEGVAVFALMYKGAMLDAEKKYVQANNCYKKIIENYPFLKKARVASGYNLCFFQKNYKEAKTTILNGDKDFINWVNLKCITLTERGVFSLVLVGLGAFFMALYTFALPIFGLIWVVSAVLLLWSYRVNQRFIFSISLFFTLFGFMIILIFGSIGLLT